ncbi:PREDICTED: uncharacterized protein LOC106921798 isoform X1 [Poecilia mexicana]|uniref:uncharacterized protein LOC106921798 isoform X1 n=1 Tax=Poecilia mexicana TaxID=48701 RepID=UPI00072E4608|nr:PREDICTED: uncharacterized protein LOC106921798 isoform X1 [Poecilia mexicana]
MAFANLFSGLSAMTEDAGSSGESDITFSNRTENGSRGRKRKTQWEIPGSYKKRFHQFQSKDNFTSRSKPCQEQVIESERSSPAQKYNHSFNSTYNLRQNDSGQNYQTYSGKKKKMNRRKKKKKKKGKNQHHDDRGPRPIKEERPKFMTQEFKDQNALLVDGRLVCRHFLSGRCIKADQCQLEHFQGYNDIIKEGCKYYIRGFCINGQSCPYMHESFPCKFFHKKGNCLQEGNCRFSHEPLNDVTEKLLEEAMEQERAFYQLAKTNKEESSEQQADAQETKPAEENKNPDLISQPLRPSFYNSTDAEKESLEQPDVTEQCASDADQPPSSSPNTQSQQEPVCYSVEAVLGPQLSRTFLSFSKTPASQDSSSASHPRTSSDRPHPNQPKAPDSAEAVFSSCKSADNSSNSQTPDRPRERTVCYAPHVISEKIQAPPFRKEEPRSSLRIIENGCRQTLPESLSCLEVKKRPTPDSLPVLSYASGNEMEGQKTCIKQKLLHHPEMFASSRSREIEDSLAGTKPSEISTGQACLVKPPKPALSKGRGAVPNEPVIRCNKRREAGDASVHHFELSNILPSFKRKHSDARPATLEHHSSKNSIKSSSDTANRGDFSSESNKTVKRSFSSLFASPLPDSVTPGSNSLTAAVRPQRSADVQIPSLPFCSLFASPLGENSPSFPSSKTQTAESKQRDCDRRCFPSQLRMHHRRMSSISSQSCKTENDAVKPPSAAVCSILSGSACEPSSSSRTNQNRPNVSSPKDTSAPSVLKSLFVQLRPYPEDGEQKGSGQSRDQSVY